MSITWNGDAKPSMADAVRKTRKAAAAKAKQNERNRRGDPRHTEATRIPQNGTAQGFDALLHVSSIGPLRWERD